MTPKPLWIHLGWAAAVGAAFLIGSKAGAPSAEEVAAAQAAAGSQSGRFAGGFADSTSSRVAKTDDRNGTDERNQLLKLFGSATLDEAGIDEVVRQAIRDPNPLTRRLAFARLLESMTPENAMQIREQLVAQGAQGESWNDFNYAFGAIAGRTAFEFAMTSDEPDLGAAFRGWAAADPTAAMAMLDNLPPELARQRRNLERDLISGLADRDVGLATQTALQLGAEDARHGAWLMAEVANEALREGGAESASMWVETLPDGPQKGAAMRRVTESYVRDDPAAAAAWAGQFADQDYAVRAIAEIGDEWSEDSPQDAIGWIETLPAGNSKNAGYSEAFGNWEDRNPEAATQYLSGMQAGPERDAAISGFSRGYAWQDPQMAIAWAQDISDPGMRERSLVQAGQAYFRRDPQNAMTWLEQSGLSNDAQQAVMSGGRRGWRR